MNAILIASAALLLQANPIDVKLDAAKVNVQQLTYAQPDGTRNAATLVTPAASGPTGRAAGRPAILFLHWYGPPDPTSNRTQYLPEAVELAQSGVVSLLVDTPWSKERWFATRDSAKDYEFTVQMTKNVKRALDVLLAQPGLDRTRIAVVGHDFGAMWGALAVADDPRVTHFAYAAGTSSFTDWYLYTPKREGAEREAFVARLAPLDPIAHLLKIAPRPVLLQFGTRDEHVKNESATAQAEAAKEPKTVKIYPNAGHELTYQARVDRLAWIRQQFKLQP
ncbi:MAG TPA: prolyl oligopeptidase family serine peptidase [Vicinamibacterales bacterium]|nr:prolyl oligopeptidase family serine peptidase [Vicinamibacterales bacterium]